VGRIGGQNLDADVGDRFSADERTFFTQFGKDWTLSRGANGGSTHAGATVTIGSTSASFDDSARSIAGLSDSTGTVETQAQSVRGYWTKYLPDGTYFDGVGQFTQPHAC
jgi:outer membrane autotransporter protein